MCCRGVLRSMLVLDDVQVRRFERAAQVPAESEACAAAKRSSAPPRAPPSIKPLHPPTSVYARSVYPSFAASCAASAPSTAASVPPS